MLSIYTLKSVSIAAKYYQQGDYYTQSGANEYSQWLGRGTEALGLKGTVDFTVFKELLGGYLPNGIVMTNTKNGRYHRPGYDLTFSAPKSVSILALVGNNQEVLEAYREALKETVIKIEQKYAGSRNKEKGATTIEKTNNFVIAAFEHVDSREGDPNLHTHLVLMNLTLRSDGEWRTLFFDEVYEDKLLNGMEFRSRLAQKLLKLGYELEFKEKGTFEIAGVPEPLRKWYSKRREEIKEWLNEHHLSGGLAAKIANFETRADKQTVKLEVQKEHWINELVLAGYSFQDLKKVYSEAKIRGPIELPDPYKLSQSTLKVAIEHLSERQPLFAISDLIKAAKTLSLLPSTEADFLRAIEEKIQDKTLIYVEDKYLRTRVSSELEVKIDEEMQKGKNSVYKILTNWIADIKASSILKTETEQKALKFLLTTTDRQVLISTQAMPLLNEVLRAFNAVCEAQRYYPRFLIEKMMNVQTLKNKLKTEEVNTIEGFLLACEARAEKRNPNPNILERWDRRIKAREARETWVVQGEISLNQVARLQQYSKEFGSRLIFTQSNHHNIFALEALKAKEISHTHITVPEYYKADLKAKDAVLKSIRHLESKNAIKSVAEPIERLNRAVQRYISKPASTSLVTIANQDRIKLNQLVREELKIKGVLRGNAISINTLQALALTLAEKSQCQLYQPGDVIRFNHEEPGTLIQKGSYFEVYHVDLASGTIMLQDKENNRVIWSPLKTKNLKGIDVFRLAPRELMVGDTIVWTRTMKHESDKRLDRIKGEKTSIIAIDDYKVTVLLKNGETLVMDGKAINQHWDHGYAVLLKNVDLSAQKESMIVLQSHLIDHKTIYGFQEFFTYCKEGKLLPYLICDNLEKLKETIDKGGVSHLSVEGKPETFYKREEALSKHQTIATQPIFHRLQTEYLKVRQLNPEFLDKNLQKNKEELSYSPEFRLACDVVDRVSLYHAEREAVFSLKQLQKEAVQLGGLETAIENIEKAVLLAIEKGWLVVVPQKEEQEESWVASRHTVLMEKLCIQKMKDSQNQLTPILAIDSPLLQNVQERKYLTKGQKEAIQLVFTSPDRFIAIQGIAGVGKTTALKEIKGVCEAIGYEALVIAETGHAKNQAKTKSGMKSMTTAQFLARVEPLLEKDFKKAQEEYDGKRLIILDEASMISTQSLFRLEKAVEKLEVRASWLGDFKQIGSIGSGDILYDSLLYGVNKVAINENVRLTDVTAFAAMKKSYAGDMAGALAVLKDSIEEIPVKDEALARMVEVYFAIKSTGENPLVITPLNEDRRIINTLIRERLKKDELLQGKPLEMIVYCPTDRREVEKKEITSYKAEDIIRFNTHHPRLGVKAGDYVKIVDIDLKHHRLTLKLEDGKIFYWAPKNLRKVSDIEIYSEEKREFLQNEEIVFKRNQEAIGIFNGDKATILEIKNNTAQVLLTDGRKVWLDFNKKENQHVEYGYALTPSASQGKEAWVITYGECPKPYLRKTTELLVGDRIILPKEDQPLAVAPYKNYSKNVTLTEINPTALTVQDNDGKIYTLNAHKNREWHYFPPFEARKEHELPLSSSQQAWIVQTTRGDGFFMVVPNLVDFQKTLERHERPKRSALSHFDLNREDLEKAVKKLVENIRGKVKEKERAESNHSYEKEATLREKDHTALKLKRNSKTKVLRDNFSVDVDALNAHLQQNILGYATQWLGSPRKITGGEARWEGALTVQLSGSKAGWWKRWSVDRESGRNLISLYMQLHNVTKEGYGEALRELAKSCGMGPLKAGMPKIKPSGFKNTKQNQKSEEEHLQRIAKVRKEYAKGIPIPGTLAETYLKQYRGIMGDLPEDFKFRKDVIHLDTKKPTPTLIAPIRDKHNRITGLLRIYLNADGSKFSETYLDKNNEVKYTTRKSNLGLTKGGATVVQQGVLPMTVWIAEGLETALSVAKAVPNQTVLSSNGVENVKSVPLSSEVQKVVICADNDGVNSKSGKTVVQAVEHFLSEGKRVFIAMPLDVPIGLDKYDFNDVLCAKGLGAVKEILDKKCEIKDVKMLREYQANLIVGLEKMKEILPEISTQKPLKLEIAKEEKRLER